MNQEQENNVWTEQAFKAMASEGYFSRANTSAIIVQTDPTVTFNNGMTLWLADKGQTVEINQYDWDLLQQADRYIKHIGKYRYAPASKQTVVAKVAKKENKSFLATVTAFLFGWMN